MNIERRLRSLEAEQGGAGGVIVVMVPAGMSPEEAERRHFGEQEPPKNALIVMIQKFSEVAA